MNRTERPGRRKETVLPETTQANAVSIGNGGAAKIRGNHRPVPKQVA